MKIALFASNRTTVPPQPGTISASAWLVSALADHLVDRGHDVTLYAPSGSTSKAKVIDLGLPPSSLDFSMTYDEWDSKDSFGEKLCYLAELYRHAANYDVINLHTEPVYLGMPLAIQSSTPTVFTNHNIFRTQQQRIFQYYRNLPIVSISDFQRTLMPDLNYLATIHNGVAVEKYPVFTEPYEHLSFIGRLTSAKGVAEGIAAAKAAGKSLQVAGVGRKDFIEDIILPHISDQIKFIGPINAKSDRWYSHYGSAKATLVPIQWEEPFGLVSIESMATGTPVIGIARGAVPEIIVDGVTGFLVNPSNGDRRGDFLTKATGVDGLREAIDRLYALPTDLYMAMRRHARRHIMKNFSVDSMVTSYEAIYKKCLSLG